jgi:hypothetical protein
MTEANRTTNSVDTIQFTNTIIDIIFETSGYVLFSAACYTSVVNSVTLVCLNCCFVSAVHPSLRCTQPLRLQVYRYSKQHCSACLIFLHFACTAAPVSSGSETAQHRQQQWHDLRSKSTYSSNNKAHE